MTVTFPQELVDEVLGYLAEYSWTLGACSLVCRAWVIRSRSYIFETCIIHEDNVEGFCYLLRSPECTFLRSIRTIHAVRGIPHQQDSFFNEIPQFQLPNVRTLDLTIGITVELPDADPSFYTGFFAQAAFPHVTRLIIGRNYYTSPDFPVALDLICLFPALRELHILDLSRTMARPSSDIPPVPPGLHSLHLCPNSANPVLTWLRSVGHLSNVRSLTFPPLRTYDVSIKAALQHLGDALHHLDIHMQAMVVTSSRYPALKSLILHSGMGSSGDHLAPLINGLVAPALECLVLHMLSNPILPDWPALDASLCPVRFPCLRSVIFKGFKFKPDVTRDFLRTALPSLGPGVVEMES
ncbi:hypothetical protein C8R45DRAFT_1080952 [Mycena sanguinolenta]|nr:hypothetical protein C8R45DRAFT_1080952 [Mycena sanguinolenta]